MRFATGRCEHPAESFPQCHGRTTVVRAHCSATTLANKPHPYPCDLGKPGMAHLSTRVGGGLCAHQLEHACCHSRHHSRRCSLDTLQQEQRWMEESRSISDTFQCHLIRHQSPKRLLDRLTHCGRQREVHHFGDIPTTQGAPWYDTALHTCSEHDLLEQTTDHTTHMT